MNLRTLGTDKERTAAQYLMQNNYEILAQNYYTHFGEIDIIGKNEGYLCFIEVKYRNGAKDGFPEDAVDMRKSKRISRSALAYLNMCGLPDTTPCRFDIVSILNDEISLYKDAFDYIP